MLAELLVLGLSALPSLVAVSSHRTTTADVLIVAASRRGRRGLNSMTALLREEVQNEATSVVLVTGDLLAREAVHVLEQGPTSFVSWRQASLIELGRIVVDSREGNCRIPGPVVAAALLRARGPGGGATTGPADNRDAELLRLLADGLSTVQIAQRLSFSERTIKNMVAGLSERWGARNRTHLVALAFQYGIL